MPGEAWAANRPLRMQFPLAFISMHDVSISAQPGATCSAAELCRALGSKQAGYHLALGLCMHSLRTACAVVLMLSVAVNWPLPCPARLLLPGARRSALRGTHATCWSSGWTASPSSRRTTSCARAGWRRSTPDGQQAHAGAWRAPSARRVPELDQAELRTGGGHGVLCWVGMSAGPGPRSPGR